MLDTPRTASPFKFGILQTAFNITELFLRPFLLNIHEVLGPCIQTTSDKNHVISMWLRWLAFVPLRLSIISLSAVPALLAFCLRNILNLVRSPYVISYNPLKFVTTVDQWPVQSDSVFSVSTANICLLPGVMSKFNNLWNPMDRARMIGERFFIDQTFHRTMVHHQSNYKIKSSESERLNKEKDSCALSSQFVNILTHFPHTDFVCFQEAYDRDCTKLLVAELHKTFPWIVYDVGFWSPQVNRCGMNSGLMVASRHEVLAVDFKIFQMKKGVFSFLSPGLLMIKVLLSDVSDNHSSRRKVGYIFNTHLQAFQGDEPIVDQQMSDILKWTNEFRQATADHDDEMVFDVLCGDFNIDNMSPGEVHLSHHELFKVYRDVGREKPGTDCDWTIGTELRSPTLMDEIMSTPEGLHTVLKDPYLRQKYVLDADIKTATLDSIYMPSVKTDANGNPVLSPVGGRRRIDFILYRNDIPVEVQNYNFITRLGNLTDHVPVSMTFKYK